MSSRDHAVIFSLDWKWGNQKKKKKKIFIIQKVLQKKMNINFNDFLVTQNRKCFGEKMIFIWKAIADKLYYDFLNRQKGIVAPSFYWCITKTRVQAVLYCFDAFYWWKKIDRCYKVLEIWDAEMVSNIFWQGINKY